uniref:Pituitary tumor-transforming gene 1 protein-interacting protein n=1 Tax=Hadrurus spadix TaxID=141984 RepID=A0A1W7R9X7_9SCOR
MNLLFVGLSFLVTCYGATVTEITGAIDNNVTTASSTKKVQSSSETIQTTTPKVETCSDGNTTTCEACLEKGTKCYFCRKTKKCAPYPYTHIAPRPGECGSLGDVAWGTCVVNFEILIIAMSVIGGILIIGLLICCCCCCRKKGRDKWAKQQAKWEREREERKARNEERKKERQAKTDEIRRKYGLKIGGDNPYQRFDA